MDRDFHISNVTVAFISATSQLHYVGKSCTIACMQNRSIQQDEHFIFKYCSTLKFMEWQRKIMKKLMYFLSKIEKYIKGNIKVNIKYVKNTKKS